MKKKKDIISKIADNYSKRHLVIFFPVILLNLVKKYLKVIRGSSYDTTCLMKNNLNIDK